MPKSMYIVVHEETGARLCKDNKLRDFACFGTYPECVKKYKRKGNAENATKRFPWGSSDKLTVVALNEGDVMDASGNVTRNGKIFRNPLDLPTE